MIIRCYYHANAEMLPGRQYERWEDWPRLSHLDSAISSVRFIYVGGIVYTVPLSLVQRQRHAGTSVEWRASRKSPSFSIAFPRCASLNYQVPS